MKTLSLERHNLGGKLPTSLLSQQLWLLLSRGTAVTIRPKAHCWEHLHPPLAPRNILGRQRKQQGYRPVNKSNWSLALHHLPQLAALTSSDATQSADDQPVARGSLRPVYSLAAAEQKKIEKKSVFTSLTQQCRSVVAASYPALSILSKCI